MMKCGLTAVFAIAALSLAASARAQDHGRRDHCKRWLRVSPGTVDGRRSGAHPTPRAGWPQSPAGRATADSRSWAKPEASTGPTRWSRNNRSTGFSAVSVRDSSRIALSSFSRRHRAVRSASRSRASPNGARRFSQAAASNSFSAATIGLRAQGDFRMAHEEGITFKEPRVSINLVVKHVGR